MADPAHDAIAALTQFFVGDATVQETLERVCAATADAVEPAVAAGISMFVEGQPGTYVATRPDIAEIDAAQYGTGDGPCVTALNSGEVVVLRSTLDPGPFPAFRHAAAERGMRSVLSVPMVAAGQRVGALNLYSDREDAFGPHDVATASGFAAQASFLLVNSQSYWDARALGDDLATALASRAVIEQAKGIIMATSGCGAEEAFDQLRQEAHQLDVKMRQLAIELVTRAGEQTATRG